MTSEDAKWLSERFGVSPDSILWYHSGICYSRLSVKTKEDAEKASKSVKGETVNGGWYHGMPLGGISKVAEFKGVPAHFEVMV